MGSHGISPRRWRSRGAAAGGAARRRGGGPGAAAEPLLSEPPIRGADRNGKEERKTSTVEICSNQLTLLRSICIDLFKELNILFISVYLSENCQVYILIHSKNCFKFTTFTF